MGAGQIELSCLKWGKKLMVFLLLEWRLLACMKRRRRWWWFSPSPMLFFVLFYGPKMQNAVLLSRDYQIWWWLMVWHVLRIKIFNGFLLLEKAACNICPKSGVQYLVAPPQKIRGYRKMNLFWWREKVSNGFWDLLQVDWSARVRKFWMLVVWMVVVWPKNDFFCKRILVMWPKNMQLEMTWAVCTVCIWEIKKIFFWWVEFYSVWFGLRIRNSIMLAKFPKSQGGVGRVKFSYVNGRVGGRICPQSRLGGLFLSFFLFVNGRVGGRSCPQKWRQRGGVLSFCLWVSGCIHRREFLKYGKVKVVSFVNDRSRRWDIPQKQRGGMWIRI